MLVEVSASARGAARGAVEDHVRAAVPGQFKDAVREAHNGLKVASAGVRSRAAAAIFGEGVAAVVAVASITPRDLDARGA